MTISTVRDVAPISSRVTVAANSFQMGPMDQEDRRLRALQDGTAGHAKRLRSYIKGSAGSIFALMGTIYTSIQKHQRNAIFIDVASICLLLALFFNFVLVVLSEGITLPSKNCFPHQHREHFYISIYGSTFMLILSGFFLLLFGNVKYAPLAIFPILTLVILIILYYQGYKCGHAQSAMNYMEHDAKLNYNSELSAAVTAAAFVGLMTYIFSSPTPPQQNGEVKPTEIFLYIALVISLLLMQLTAVPTAFSDSNARAHMVRAIRYLSYMMMGVLILVALLATGEVLQGVISTLITVAGTIIFLVVIILNEIMEYYSSSGNETAEEIELDTLAMMVVAFAFGVIMVVYSTYVDNRPKVNYQYFLLLLCLISLCTSFITSLSKALFLSHGTTFGDWPRAKMIFNHVTYSFAFVAAVSFLLTRVL